MTEVPLRGIVSNIELLRTLLLTLDIGLLDSAAFVIDVGMWRSSSSQFSDENSSAWMNSSHVAWPLVLGRSSGCIDPALLLEDCEPIPEDVSVVPGVPFISPPSVDAMLVYDTLRLINFEKEDDWWEKSGDVSQKTSLLDVSWLDGINELEYIMKTSSLHSWLCERRTVEQVLALLSFLSKEIPSSLVKLADEFRFLESFSSGLLTKRFCLSFGVLEISEFCLEVSAVLKYLL